VSIYDGSNIQSTIGVSPYETDTCDDAAPEVYPLAYPLIDICNTELTFLSRAIKGVSILFS